MTGPNAGGKTVALKTYGLFAFMVKMGLGIPSAKDSRSISFQEYLLRWVMNKM